MSGFHIIQILIDCYEFITYCLLMQNLSTVDRIEDDITFGAGFIPFTALLVTVFFAFVFGLIRFQNVRAPFGPLSSLLYSGFILIGLVTAYALLRWIGTRTFASRLHDRRSAVLAVVIYFGMTLAAVFIGYLIINPQPSAVGRLGFPDVLVGATVASIYTAILSSSSLLQDVPDLFGQTNERKRCVEAWIDAHNEAVKADGFGHIHTEAYERFTDTSVSLSEALDDAKTNEGQRLQNEFHSWLSEFRGQESTVRRYAILTGETENNFLVEQHERLTWIRQEIEDIGGDGVWTDTNL